MNRLTDSLKTARRQSEDYLNLNLTLGEDYIHVEGECVVGEAGLPGHVTELVLGIVISSPPLRVLFVIVNGPKRRNEAKDPCTVYTEETCQTHFLLSTSPVAHVSTRLLSFL